MLEDTAHLSWRISKPINNIKIAIFSDAFNSDDENHDDDNDDQDNTRNTAFLLNKEINRVVQKRRCNNYMIIKEEQECDYVLDSRPVLTIIISIGQLVNASNSVYATLRINSTNVSAAHVQQQHFRSAKFWTIPAMANNKLLTI